MTLKARLLIWAQALQARAKLIQQHLVRHGSRSQGEFPGSSSITKLREYFASARKVAFEYECDTRSPLLGRSTNSGLRPGRACSRGSELNSGEGDEFLEVG